nr:uncharacterized protein LOC111518306 [Leptinotarsa decemlineata]XP_023030490.1 uncharacterized protein LOC111518306 [Leptinotarsa decemlineata]XP_023030491.1 uncharacterized protein LOC111518306 [Leptinotarsa decemlineata]XP_023030492.1 uncharacterized protein LOC111518306 [Leptinotarsa decemlineata]
MEAEVKQIFPTPFTMDTAMTPKTVRELHMIRLSQEIREKERWAEKINDDDILEHWRNEINEDKHLVDYVFDELKYYASRTSNGIEVGAIDGTWQASRLIDPQLKNNFKKYVHDTLENVDESQKDYHPWSKNQVVDLVHPSLYCYVKGVTKVDKLDDKLDYIEDEYKTTSSGAHASELHISTKPVEENIYKYQWLPSEFHVDSEGKVFINSYINNLNPKKHEPLYSMIGQIFEKFIPLFNRVLTDLLNIPKNRIEVSCFLWYKDSEKDSHSYDSEDFSKEPEDNREIQWPEIPKFTPPEPGSEIVDVRGRNLQVIVKLANIELTPKEPKYAGGVWHVEGTENEAIVATGIYYYSSSNITESRLFFKQGIEDPDYEQYDGRGVKEFYGLEDGDPLSQEIGSIVCGEDCCIAFPNIYQHRVGPFELVDKTKNGHRKILVFFLVDPNKRILSTKHVAPQQRSWIESENRESNLKFTMSFDDARMYREKLMLTRKFDESTKEYDFGKPECFYERRFSLCEH